MRVWKWGALAIMAGALLLLMTLASALSPMQIAAVQEMNQQANLADELREILQEQGATWGFDWTWWAAYWGGRNWALPVEGRLHRLHAAQDYNIGLRSNPCHPEHEPEPKSEGCADYQVPPDKPTDRASIEADWRRAAREYLNVELQRLLGRAPASTEQLVEALKASVSPADWRTVEELQAAYQEISSLRSSDSAGLSELAEGEDYTLFLRLKDWYYTFPVAGQYEPLTDTWGADRPQNQRAGVSERHHGTDIMAAKGTPVVAVTNGRVVRAGWNDLGGWSVMLVGDDGVRHYYAHLAERPSLSEGQAVYRGQAIGAVGDSGEGPEGTVGKMAPHLHYAIYTGENPELVTNPFPYLMHWLGGDDSDHVGISPVDPPADWVPVDGFAWPAEGPITSRFGMRVSPIDGVNRLHAGIDLGVSYGVPIRASKAGTVRTAGWSDVYGWVVVVDHGDGYTTLYAHNSELLVRVQDQVQQGQVVSRAGSTGWSTGTHLHFETHFRGTPIDPLLLLPPKAN